MKEKERKRWTVRKGKKEERTLNKGKRENDFQGAAMFDSFSSCRLWR